LAVKLLSPKHIIAWDKGDRGTVGDLACGFGEAWEAILYGMKGRRPLNGTRPRTVLRFDWSGAMDPRHPTCKPVGLLKQLVRWSSSTEETVLDPFMGSGSTGKAALKEGFRFIGIERDEESFKISIARISHELKKEQTRLIK
jgi:site-specific DNA-methyltransferase (adenine-specific)